MSEYVVTYSAALYVTVQAVSEDQAISLADMVTMKVEQVLADKVNSSEWAIVIHPDDALSVTEQE